MTDDGAGNIGRGFQRNGIFSSHLSKTNCSIIVCQCR
jgi:hypothetical protein